MPTVYLSPSAQSANLGYGNYGTEKQRCEQIAAETRTLLIRWGVDVKWPTADDMTERVKEANAQGVDLYLPIHTNAGGGRGCEVLVLDKYATGSKPYASESKRFAQILYGRISAITPSSDRGVKTDVYNFYEIREPKCPCAYLETAFHDNKEDAEWIVNNILLIGQEIALAVCDYFGIQPKESTEKQTMYRVETDAFSNKDDAFKFANQIKQLGYISTVVQETVIVSEPEPIHMPTPALKSIEQVAKEVIAGKWGNGTERKNKLIAAGYDYNAVQNKVNELL